jgi:spermidine synthase
MPSPVWLGVVAFVSGACLMTLEIIAGRLLAPFVGVSIHTWTSIIGVVLAGLSVGAFVGGRLIDRHPSRNKLAAALIAAGCSSLLGLTVESTSASMLADPGGALGLVLVAGVLFLPPSLFLGAITPMTARLAIKDVAASGHTIGWLHGLGAAGSIVGTFATGFGFVALGSSHHIVLGVSLCLLLLGAVTLRAPRARVAASLAVLVVAVGGVVAPDRVQGPCERETAYNCIRVAPLFIEGRTGRVLFLDRMVHGYAFPDDATKLAARSSEIFADLAQSELRAPSARALVLGGGAYVLPRYLAVRFPNVQVDVVEIAPAVPAVARERLGLTLSPRLAIHHQDARTFVRRAAAERYDLLVADVFTDLSLPFHLSTLEFAQQVRSVLKHGGTYALHLVDAGERTFLRSVVHTLRHEFDHVDVVRGNEHGAGNTASFVVVASDARVAYPPRLAGRLMAPGALDALMRAGPLQLLTDAHAPIEHMRAQLL